jgi:S-formylglutathione hydrolase FrmB
MGKFFGPMGSVSRVTIESQALKSNMPGDLSARVVDVYIPAGHDGQGLPLLVDLVDFTSSGLSQTNWVGFRENTRLSGNRYINSASTGAWEDFLLHECSRQSSSASGGGTGRRGLFGKSSGGYGAITHALPKAIMNSSLTDQPSGFT